MGGIIGTNARNCLFQATGICLFLWAIGGTLGWAQTAAPSDNAEPASDPAAELKPDLASPRAAITTFLKAIEAADGSDDEQQWSKVYQTLEIPESAGVARRDAALRLKQVLNRLGDLDPDKVAPNAEQTAAERLERFELYPENPFEGALDQFDLKVRSRGEEAPGSLVLAREPKVGWRFNSESIEAINPLFGWLEEMGAVATEYEDDDETPLADVIRSRVPDWMKRGFFLGMEVWQWGLITIIVLVSVGAYWLGTIVFSTIITLIWRRVSTNASAEERRRVARPIALILGALTFILLLKLLGVIGTALAVFLLTGRLVLMAGVTWTAWSLVNFLTHWWERHSEKSETTFDDMLVPLVRKTLKLIIIVWAIIYVADSIDVLNFVTPLLAGFGLAGLAVSFAAQDLIKNLFGGVTIFLDQPFQVGERVVFEGFDGVVENIGFRSTRMRTADGHVVTVPNGAITSNCVENIGRRPSIRRDITLGITYDTSPAKIREALAAIRQILEEPEIRELIRPLNDSDENPPRIFFEDFTDSALVIRVIYWFANSDYWAYVDHANRVNLRLLEEMERLGVEFAFPTQTLHIANPGKASGTFPETLGDA